MAKRVSPRKTGNGRDEQESQEPGIEEDDGGQQRQKREQLLRHTGQAGEHTQPGAGLAAGALHFVVEDGVFKRDQVERAGVFHHPDADVVAEPVSQQAVYQADETAGGVGAESQKEFKDKELPDHRAVYSLMPDASDDQVNDQFRDPEGGKGEESGDAAQG